jgi:hypothetical protein
MTLSEQIDEIQATHARALFVDGYTLDEFEVDWELSTNFEQREYLNTCNAPAGTRAGRLQRRIFTFAAALATIQIIDSLAEETIRVEEKIQELGRERDDLKDGLGRLFSSLKDVTE